MSTKEKKPLKFYTDALATADGRRRFISSAVVGSGVAFFALSGLVAFLIALGFRQYGVDRALSEMHVVTGVEATAAIWKLFYGQLDALVIFGLVIGLMVGLRAVGEVDPQAAQSASK